MICILNLNNSDIFIIIKAYDLGTPSLSSLVQVLIYVADENDHRPVFDKTIYRMAIPEDTPGGTTVLSVSFIFYYAKIS